MRWNNESSGFVLLQGQGVTVARFVGILLILTSFLTLAFRNGADTNVGFGAEVPITTAAGALPDLLGYSDNGFYVSTSLDIADGGILTADSQFSLRQWAPGLPLILSAFVLVWGPGVPLGVLWGLSLVAMLTAAFGYLLTFAANIKRVAISTAAALLVIWSFPFTDWIFGSGYFYSEGASLAWALLALLLLADARLSPLARGVLGGAAITIAAYFKATFEFAGLILVMVALLLMAILVLRKLYRKTSERKGVSKSLSNHVIACAAITFLLLTLPWRIWSDINLYPDRWTWEWTQHTSVYWGHRWMPTDWLEENGSAWFSDNGGNSACIVRPDMCLDIASAELASAGNYSGGGAYSQEEFRSLTVEAFLSAPVEWLASRAPFLQRAWFFDSGGNLFKILQQIAYLVSTVVALMLLPRSRSRGLIPAAVWFAASITGIVGALVLQQIEVRYLFPIQVMGVFFVILFLLRRPLGAVRQNMPGGSP